MKNKISVIVPIYNSELYLKECLDSILVQEYKNFEVIMINDGSTDSSKNICEEYIKKDNRFKLINQSNKGISSARNIGIKNATGNYMIFIDSDDYIEEGAFNYIINNIKDYQFFCYGFYYLYLNKKKKNIYKSEIVDMDIIKDNIFLNNIIGGYLWNKVFLSSLIKKNNILFDEKIHYCEDLLFVNNYLKFCNKVKYNNIVLYYYRMRKSSVTYSFNNIKNVSILKSYEQLINNYDFNKKYTDYFKYKYLFYYYKLKSIITNNNILTNESIIKDATSIIKKQNLYNKLRILFIMLVPNLYSNIKKVVNSIFYKLYN